MRSAIRDDLDCDELVELVTEYLESALPPADRTRFEHHLVWCPGCTTYLRQVRATRGLALRIGGAGAHGDGAAAQGGEARAKLLAAFRAWKGEEAAR